MAYQGTFGVHFPIHQPGWLTMSAARIVELAQHAAGHGFQTVWVNDNFKARHTFSVLSAMAARVPIGLATLVTHPYARNPMDLATAIGTVAELLGERPLRVGISSGAWAIQGVLVERPSPSAAVQEAIAIARQLLSGEEVALADFPILAAYFNIKPAARLKLQFRPGTPVSFWLPPKGPKMLDVAARVCDGVIFNTYTQYAALPHLRSGKLAQTLRDMEAARAQAGNRAPLRRVFKLDMSLAAQREAARQFARNFVSFNAAGDADRYRGVGLDDELDRLRDRYKTGASIEQSAELVGEKLIDLVVLAGTPDDVRDRFAEYVDAAERLDFEQVILAVPVGPDPFQAIELAGKEVIGKLVA
jgi:alkanesulfonate monooxygenase SsuD/methylene tetrahydromethanopterin reductase-like flavin-dependent oxidoreductase (luciferase family)